MLKEKEQEKYRKIVFEDRINRLKNLTDKEFAIYEWGQAEGDKGSFFIGFVGFVLGLILGAMFILGWIFILQ